MEVCDALLIHVPLDQCRGPLQVLDCHRLPAARHLSVDKKVVDRKARRVREVNQTSTGLGEGHSLNGVLEQEFCEHRQFLVDAPTWRLQFPVAIDIRRDELDMQFRHTGINGLRTG